VRVTLNGRDREAPDAATVLALLESEGLKPGRVAVEVNGRVVPRVDLHRTPLATGDVVEVVHFVGGG